MITLRTAAQQALEALKLSTPKTRRADDDYAEQGWTEHNTAITALRAALAQRAAKPQRPKCLEFALDFLGTPENGELLAYIEQLEVQRDALLEALKSTGLFLHHCWCDVQMNDHSFEKLNRQMEIVDAAIKAVEGEKA